MYYDYFLMHRALQVQKLRAAREGNCLELPSRIARAGAAKPVLQLCRMIDTLCGWDLGDKPKRDRWGWLKIRSRKWWPRAAAAEEQPEERGRECGPAAADRRTAGSDQRFRDESGPSPLGRRFLRQPARGRDHGVAVAGQRVLQRPETAGRPHRELPLRVPVSDLVQSVRRIDRLRPGRRPSSPPSRSRRSSSSWTGTNGAGPAAIRNWSAC